MTLHKMDKCGCPTYILEVLEDEVDRTEYIDFLRRLRFTITARLDTGGW
jgi:hypothetical protein